MRSKSVPNVRPKRPWLWISLILLSLLPLGILSSRGQNLLVNNKEHEIPASKSFDPLLNDSVFSPLAFSVHIRNGLSPTGRHIVYGEDATAAEEIPWSSLSESPWWVPDSTDLPMESDDLQPDSVQAESEGSVQPDPQPRLLHRDIDTQAIIINFITMGVDELLNDLRENDLKLQSKKDESNMNPFDKALKEASKEADEASCEKKDDSGCESAKEEIKDTDEGSGVGGNPTYRKILFAGSFGGHSVATAVGSAQADLLRQSMDSTVVIDLKGIGKQTLDMDVVLRNRDSEESVAYGDLNRDGFSDMVVTNKTTNKIRIFRNDGADNYRLSGEIFGGLGPSTALICDFNADGSSDIAVALQIDKTIIVDGRGLRKFIFFPTSPVKEEFSSMLPYDFDGDGLLDLLLTDYQNLTASVYLNRGQGLFAESSSLDLQSFPYLQTEADLDGDGIEDLVYVQSLGARFSVVMLNGRDHTISNLGNMTLDSSSYFVLGDFNLDGVVDVAIAHRK